MGEDVGGWKLQSITQEEMITELQEISADDKRNRQHVSGTLKIHYNNTIQVAWVCYNVHGSDSTSADTDVP